MTLAEVLRVFIGGGVSIAVVLFTVPLLVKVAYEKNLYDKPDGDRKLHMRYISNLGGVSLYLALVTGITLASPTSEFQTVLLIFGALTMLFFTGLKDDLIGLSAKTKLIIQLITTALPVIYVGHVISDFGGVFGVETIPLSLAIVVTFGTFILITNSINLIDGMDGLCGGLSLIASIGFAIGFYSAGEFTFALMATIMSCVLTGYLYHNFHPAKIFMGDSGSLVIGFMLSMFVVKFVMIENISGSLSDWFDGSSAILPLSFIAIPLYDTLRVFLRRILNGRSPFEPDADHIHHVLLTSGLGQRRAAIFLYLSAILIICMTLLTVSLNPNWSLAIVMVSCLLFLPTNGTKTKVLKAIGIDIIELLSPRTNIEDYKHLSDNQEKMKRRDKIGSV